MKSEKSFGPGRDKSVETADERQAIQPFDFLHQRTSAFISGFPLHRSG
jgi:hypothetical protein